MPYWRTGVKSLITIAKQALVYGNAWVTSHAIDENNVLRLSFRAYNAHGKQHLSNFLSTLNLLVFLAHTALEWLDEAYRTVRCRLPPDGLS